MRGHHTPPTGTEWVFIWCAIGVAVVFAIAWTVMCCRLGRQDRQSAKGRSVYPVELRKRVPQHCTVRNFISPRDGMFTPCLACGHMHFPGDDPCLHCVREAEAAKKVGS